MISSDQLAISANADSLFGQLAERAQQAELDAANKTGELAQLQSDIAGDKTLIAQMQRSKQVRDLQATIQLRNEDLAKAAQDLEAVRATLQQRERDLQKSQIGSRLLGSGEELRRQLGSLDRARELKRSLQNRRSLD